MKKTLAVLFAVLMLLASLTVCFAVFANSDGTDGTICEFCHKKHTSMNDQECTCCLNCRYLDLSKVSECAKDAYGVKNKCCDNCTGFYNCTCGKYDSCPMHCYACQGKGDEPQPDLEPVISEQSQLHIKDIFQSVIQKISEVFDRMFEVAFAIFNIK